MRNAPETQNKLFISRRWVHFLMIPVLILVCAGQSSAQSGNRRQPPPPPTSTSPAQTVPGDSTSPPEPSGPPLSEAEFFKLLQQAQKKTVTQGDIAAILEAQGISFEASDAFIERARTAGAQSLVISALVRAEERRKRARYALTEPDRRGSPPKLTRREQTPLPESDESSEEDKEKAVAKLPFLEQVRFYAHRSVEDLPDFIVRQLIKRFRREGGAWKQKDTLDTEVRYEQSTGEQIKLLTINNLPTTQTYEELGGTTSLGGFSAQLISPFQTDSQTKFKQIGNETYRGRSCVIYDFEVAQENSNYHLQGAYEGQRVREVTVGYRGSVWIDKDTKRVLRIEQAAVNLPRDFVLTLAESSVDYDWIDIAGKRFWLPISGEVILGNDRDAYYTRNSIQFRDYRKFEGDVKVLDQ